MVEKFPWHECVGMAILRAYWDVGREIVEKQGGEARSRYGDGLELQRERAAIEEALLLKGRK